MCDAGTASTVPSTFHSASSLFIAGSGRIWESGLPAKQLEPGGQAPRGPAPGKAAFKQKRKNASFMAAKTLRVSSGGRFCFGINVQLCGSQRPCLRA